MITANLKTNIITEAVPEVPAIPAVPAITEERVVITLDLGLAEAEGLLAVLGSPFIDSPTVNELYLALRSTIHPMQYRVQLLSGGEWVQSADFKGTFSDYNAIQARVSKHKHQYGLTYRIVSVPVEYVIEFLKDGSDKWWRSMNKGTCGTFKNRAEAQSLADAEALRNTMPYRVVKA